MAPKVYNDFDLLITKVGEKYQARVVSSPAGQAAATFDLPFSPLDLQKLEVGLEEARRGMQGSADVKSFGQRLFETAFGAGVGECLHRSIDLTKVQKRDVRIRLHLADVPDLAVFPWEYLYDPSLERFLARSGDTPLVRYMDLAMPPGDLSATRPVTILVVISDPEGMPPLTEKEEWERIKGATSKLEADGLVKVIRLDKATQDDLRAALRDHKIHVLHYIGHGVADPDSEKRYLVMEDNDGKPDYVLAEKLGVLLHDHDPLMMVVLNACHGAQGATASASAGIAQTLVRQGIPSVVAMQYEISDTAAKAFAEEFYQAFASGVSLEAAVVDARKAIYAKGNEVEWGTPVLYLRATKADLLEEAAMSDNDQNKPHGGGINISVGGNVSGKVNAAQGDIIEVGSVVGSKGVAIGRGAQSFYSENSETTTVNVFEEAEKTLASAPISDVEREDAEGALAKLKEQNNEAPKQDRVDYYLDKLEKIAPPIVELLIKSITNPGGAVADGLKIAIRTWRDARKA